MARGGVKKDLLEANKLKAKELLLQGHNANQVSKIVGCSGSSIKNWFPELCEVNRGNAKHLKQEQKDKIKILKSQLKTNKQIADEIGATVNQIKDYCEKERLILSDNQRDAQKKAIAQEITMSTDKISERIKEITNGACKYYGNYQRDGDEYKCDIQFVECGHVRTMQAQSLRHWKRGSSPLCMECRNIQSKASKHAHECKQKQVLAKRLCRALDDVIKAKKREQTYTRQCICCGETFTTNNEQKLMCSKECQLKRKKDLKKKYARGDNRYKRHGVKENYSITAKAVYKRDKGICWICKGKCNLKDFTRLSNGTVVCGGDYPSVDHIKRIRDGGKDEWENVACAHRRCNWERG